MQKRWVQFDPSSCVKKRNNKRQCTAVCLLQGAQKENTETIREADTSFPTLGQETSRIA